ncbi:MAG TPA: MBL fold metallo-hydrolase, partial [Firmicutes bacterium]|nr:MBL fold metallo-hydrolase [Bacillota bacterium]
VVGLFKTNCYFVYKEGIGVIIDPGGDCSLIKGKMEELKDVKFLYVINTHGHVDHTFCNSFLKKEMGLKILIHEEDEPFLLENSINKLYDAGFEPASPDILLSDGDIIDVKTFKFSVFHTPGHTPGSILLLTDGVIFSGDTIFKGTIGRTDLEYGDERKMKESISKILNNLWGNYVIYPGHGEKTTLDKERENLKYFFNIL